jgi:response regulator of citrate/malate metabolism
MENTAILPVNLQLVKLFGIKAAYLYSYISNRSENGNQFHVSVENMSNECFLSLVEVKKYLNILKQNKLIAVEKKKGQPSRNYYTPLV